MKHNNAKFFVPGARVCYARTFLQSIADYSHATASRRGTVIEFTGRDGYDVVLVQWSDEKEPRHVLGCNLWPADRIHLEPV